MDPVVTPVADQFRVITNSYVKALSGLDRKALVTRPGPQSNPPIWIAGHLVQSRARLLRLLGAERDLPWPELFRTGSKVVAPDGYPELSDVLESWHELTAELEARLESLTAADLAKDAPPRVASPDGTVRGAVALFGFHESYHVGQLGYVRKWLGYSSLFD